MNIVMSRRCVTLNGTLLVMNHIQAVGIFSTAVFTKTAVCRNGS